MPVRPPRKRADALGDALSAALSHTGATVDVMRLGALRRAVEAATGRGEGLREAAERLACAYDVRAHTCDYVPERAVTGHTGGGQHVFVSTGQGMAIACSAEGMRALDTYASSWALS